VCPFISWVSAVVGMGGLGRLAVTLAHAMGAEVTVLSQTLSKRDDALRLGADAYYATSATGKGSGEGTPASKRENTAIGRGSDGAPTLTIVPFLRSN